MAPSQSVRPSLATKGMQFVEVDGPALRTALAKFYADSSQVHAARSEADGVIRLYRQRAGDLATRMTLHEPEIVPVGLLMIVPEGADAP